MDFNALQHKLFELDPSDPAEDLRKLAESASGMPQENAPITESLVQESVEVQEGTMPVEGDYSLNDFAALAGVTLNEDWKKSARRGWDNYNKVKAVGLKNPIDSLLDPSKEKSKKSSPVVTKKSAKSPVRPYANDWKGFLKQHTAQLQKISADPKKKKQFDAFMAKMGENIEEERTDEILPAIAGMAARGLAAKAVGGAVDKLTANKKNKQKPIKARDPNAQYMNDLRKSGAAGGHKDKTKTIPRNQKHKKDYATESIKEMLYRKLNEKK